MLGTRPLSACRTAEIMPPVRLLRFRWGWISSGLCRSARGQSAFLHRRRLAWLDGSRSPRRAAIALWTLKESYLKASGELTEAVFAAEFQIGTGDEAAGPAGGVFLLTAGLRDICSHSVKKTKQAAA